MATRIITGTYEFNDSGLATTSITISVNFTSNGTSFTGIRVSSGGELYYINSIGTETLVWVDNGEYWNYANSNYKYIDFGDDQTIDSIAYQWIVENASYYSGATRTIFGKYVLHESNIDYNTSEIFSANFTSNGSSFTGMRISSVGELYYINSIGSEVLVWVDNGEYWNYKNPNYQTVDFGDYQIVNSAFYQWFTLNSEVWTGATRTISGQYKFYDSNIDYDTPITFSVDFTSNGVAFTGMRVSSTGELYYINSLGGESLVWVDNGDYWNYANPNYQYVNFGTNQDVDSDFYQWVNLNAKLYETGDDSGSGGSGSGDTDSGETIVNVVGSIKYKNNVLTTIVKGQTATIKCKGKIMRDNIIIKLS